MLFSHGYEGKAYDQLLPSWSMTSLAICERNHTDYVQTFRTSGYFELHSPIRLKKCQPTTRSVMSFTDTPYNTFMTFTLHCVLFYVYCNKYL
jgi:hypothetical protein